MQVKKKVGRGILTISVDNIQRARDSPNHHPGHLQRKKRQRHHIMIRAQQQPIHRLPPPVQSRTPKYHLRNNQHDPKLGLIHAPIPLRHQLRRPIRQRARNRKPNDRADKRRGIGIPRLDLAPPQRRGQEELRQDDADEDRPPDEQALDEAGPEEGGLQEERERAQQKLPEGLVRLAAVEEGERLAVGDLLRIGVAERVGGGGGRGRGGVSFGGRPAAGELLGRAEGGFPGAGAGLFDVRVGVVVGDDVGHAVRAVGVGGEEVEVEGGFAAVGGLRAEEVDQRQAGGAEDGDQVEGPPPADGVGDLADDDGREEGAAEDGEVGEGHADAALLRGGVSRAWSCVWVGGLLVCHSHARSTSLRPRR